MDNQIKVIVDSILSGDNVRQNLSNLRQEIKDEGKLMNLIDLIEDESLSEKFIDLLKNDDAKTRKNAALLLGDIAMQESLMALYSAFCKEDKLFVKASYLQAMRELDYREVLPELKDILVKIETMDIAEENKKHIYEQTKILTELIVTIEGFKAHEFRGNKEESEIILLTNRDYQDITARQINSSNIKVIPAGLQLKTDRLDQIVTIRTYKELLFIVQGMKHCIMEPMAVAKQITSSDIIDFMEKRHKGKAPFYFRIDIKSKMELDKKSEFVRKLSMEIERGTNRQLINSPSHYEFEIRIIENKDGECNMLVKLNTLADNRFSYRKEHISASIRPVNAALLVELAKEYMAADAQVLDPFCGVGTMLIERQKVVKANTSYGIDIQDNAIEKAKINTEAEGQIIHFINKSYFDFEHQYLFDEIFTNMPFAAGRYKDGSISNGYGTEEDNLYELYDKFFDKTKDHLKEDGRIIMYTHDREFVRELAPKYNYKIVKHFEILSKEKTDLFILE